MRLFSFCALLSGALFGAGLVVSGMTNPQRVIGFLDVFGNFDPRLAFVLGGALLVTLSTFGAVLKMRKPLAAARFELPAAKALDRPLIAGAALFGIGWGIGGYCPGPGLAALGAGSVEAFLFVGSLLLGSVLYGYFRSLAQGDRRAENGRQN